MASCDRVRDPWNRVAYLKGVPASGKAMAERLCDLLEQIFGVDDLRDERGMPVVIRNMEWLAGFAMRADAPRVYICAPDVLQSMAEELKPWMSGKACFTLKAGKGRTLEEGFALVEKAWRMASQGSGMISKADARRRERALGATAPPQKAKASSKPSAKKPKR